MEPNGILIYGEMQDDYTIAPVVLELLSKAAELKQGIWNQRVMVCLINKRMNYDFLIDTLGRYGADEVIVVNDDRLSKYDREYHSEIFTKIAEKYPPRMILIGATVKGKDIASYVATKLKTGLTADCTQLGIGEYNLLLSTRPTFGGQLTADILCDTFPQMATVQPNTFKAVERESCVSAKFNWIDLDKIEKRIEVVEKIKKGISNNDIASAEIVVAGGAGQSRSETIHRLESLRRVKRNGQWLLRIRLAKRYVLLSEVSSAIGCRHESSHRLRAVHLIEIVRADTTNVIQQNLVRRISHRAMVVAIQFIKVSGFMASYLHHTPQIGGLLITT